MKVHIVNPYNSAAMFRMVNPLMEHLPNVYEVTQGEEVDTSADVNIHIPFHTMIGLEDKGEGKHIIAYTHANKGQEPMVYDACQRADIVTAMTFRGRDELINMGVDPKKIHVIYCAADDFKYRKRLIGIIGYPQPNGRKREALMLDLAWQHDLTPYQFILTGEGWEGMSQRLNSLGVSCSWHHADTFEKLEATLRLLDVMLVTGYREGGPLPLLEAMASGVPVLSPDFGYAADMLDEKYIYHNTDDLMEKLNSMFAESLERHELARSWSWIDYVNEHALLIGRLTGESVDVFPERGMSRYNQLLDIIDEIKPRDICEIGTWNGNNAIRMIQQASKYRNVKDIWYQGFDLFETQTPEQFVRELSKHGHSEKIVRKRLEATGADIELVKGDTCKTLDGVITAPDLCFVDGGHSEETIQNDGIWSLAILEDNNVVVVFDDYYHEGKPEGMGCNKFIDNLDKSRFEITHLPVRTKTNDGRLIGMVKVTRNNAGISLQMQEPTYTSGSAWNEYQPKYSVSGVRQGNAPGSSDGGGELERTSPPS